MFYHPTTKGRGWLYYIKHYTIGRRTFIRFSFKQNTSWWTTPGKIRATIDFCALACILSIVSILSGTFRLLCEYSSSISRIIVASWCGFIGLGRDKMSSIYHEQLECAVGVVSRQLQLDVHCSLICMCIAHNEQYAVSRSYQYGWALLSS